MSDQVGLVIDDSGLCVNAIVLGIGWSPPAGHRVVAPSGDAWIGWRLVGDVWQPPDPEPED